jgi:hypothetical protein
VLARALLRSASVNRIVIVDSTGHDYEEYPLVTALEFAHLIHRHRTRGEFAVRIVPQDPEHFIEIVNFVLACDNLLFVIEESRVYKRAAQYEEKLVYLARMGGHYGQDLIMVGQRPQDVPPDVRSQADETYWFNVDEKEDVEIARSKLYELADDLPLMQKFECFRKVRGIHQVERMRCVYGGSPETLELIDLQRRA